jgi:hypothetical protein
MFALLWDRNNCSLQNGHRVVAFGDIGVILEASLRNLEETGG